MGTLALIVYWLRLLVRDCVMDLVPVYVKLTPWRRPRVFARWDSFTNDELLELEQGLSTSEDEGHWIIPALHAQLEGQIEGVLDRRGVRPRW